MQTLKKKLLNLNIILEESHQKMAPLRRSGPAITKALLSSTQIELHEGQAMEKWGELFDSKLQLA